MIQTRVLGHDIRHTRNRNNRGVSCLRRKSARQSSRQQKAPQQQNLVSCLFSSRRQPTRHQTNILISQYKLCHTLVTAELNLIFKIRGLARC